MPKVAALAIGLSIKYLNYKYLEGRASILRILQKAMHFCQDLFTTALVIAPINALVTLLFKRLEIVRL